VNVRDLEGWVLFAKNRQVAITKDLARVLEMLQVTVNDLEDVTAERDALAAENTQLRAALERYANPSNWRKFAVQSAGAEVMAWRDTTVDATRIARDALGDIGGEAQVCGDDDLECDKCGVCLGS